MIHQRISCRKTAAVLVCSILVLGVVSVVKAFVPFIDGGKEMPALYKGWFDDQIAKQASTAISKAISSGKTNIEVQFPAVPNVDEVKFGTPFNQKFGKEIVAKQLKVPGGYRPGSYLVRNLIAYSNIYWAKKIAPSVGGGMGGKPVTVLSTEPVVVAEIKDKGSIASIGPLGAGGMKLTGNDKTKNNALILVNPGGEETWDRMRSVLSSPSAPCVILNNAYSTTYDLGNKRGYEEAYYLKRVSKGWVFRTFPGPWQAYLERPDGTCECIKTYQQKPSLKEVATLVREESFRRYAIMNDRFAKGFGERL